MPQSGHTDHYEEGMIECPDIRHIHTKSGAKRSDCGSVVRVVASYTRVRQFKTSRRQNYFLSIVLKRKK